MTHFFCKDLGSLRWKLGLLFTVQVRLFMLKIGPITLKIMVAFALKIWFLRFKLGNFCLEKKMGFVEGVKKQIFTLQIEPIFYGKQKA